MKTKYALVTGGSRGIGKAIAKQIAKDLGYHILITYVINNEAAAQTKAEIEAETDASCETLKFDVANRNETQNVLDKWQEDHPDSIIEVIVNNAGVTRDGLFMAMSENDWDQVINTSVQGFYNITKPLITPMIRQRFGRIINIVSVSGVKGTAGQTNYSAAKAAIIGATKALAKEIAKRKVTVNAVAPGFINSDMTQDLDEIELKKIIPANRFGEAQEVADLVSFLASKKANYITGEVININGGLH